MQKETEQRRYHPLDMQSYTEANADANANPYPLLEECREVEQELEMLESHLHQLKLLLNKVPAQSECTSELSQLKSNIQRSYCAIVEHIDGLRSRPDADGVRDAAHLRQVIVRLKATVQHHERLQAEFRRDSEQTAKRHFRIVHPHATEAEVEEAVSAHNMPIFQQAVSHNITVVFGSKLTYRFHSSHLTVTTKVA